MINRIAQLRSANNLSQAQLAKEMGVSKQTIANWENGRREPDLQSLCSMSQIFKTTIDYIANSNIMNDGLSFFKMDYSIHECKDEDYICEGVPEAAIIAKVLRRMDTKQREILFNVCRATFPDEFYDVIYSVSNEKEQDD